MVRRNLQHASHSRVFTIEDRASPTHSPIYQTLARMAGLTWGQGAITPVRIPDPKQYGRYLTIDKIKGQPGLPGSSLEFRTSRDLSDMLKLIRKGCPVDIQLHIGACKDPSDFDAGWEKIGVFEDCDFTNYTTPALGAFDADQEAQITETLDFSAQDYYELKPLTFTGMAETQIVQQVVDVAICDARTCGTCGIPSDGCQRIFAVQTPAGASPGLPAEVISTQDGGKTWREGNVTSLPANRAPAAMTCVGPYLVVISTADCSIHYALITDVLAGTAVWTRTATGLVCASGAPAAIASLSRTQTWIVGAGGYVYTTQDVTAGVTVQSSGDVTTQDLTCVHAFDDSNVLAGGKTNALIVTSNGGVTWRTVTGPAGQAAVQVNTVYMLSATEWYVGYNDGKVFYTIDGGTNWTQKAIPGALTVIDKIVFATRTVGYMIGHTASVGKILRTISGGYSWYVLPEGTGATIPANLQFYGLAACGDDPNSVWAGGIKTALGDGLLVKGA